jgi:hypothetical protein
MILRHFIFRRQKGEENDSLDTHDSYVVAVSSLQFGRRGRGGFNSEVHRD